MTNSEAHKIFKAWQEFAEINDKLRQLFMGSLPQSLLPYPKSDLEKAISVVANETAQRGDMQSADKIIEYGYTLMSYEEDNEAFKNIYKFMKMCAESKELRLQCLKNLQECKDSWDQHKHKNNL